MHFRSTLADNMMYAVGFSLPCQKRAARAIACAVSASDGWPAGRAIPAIDNYHQRRHKKDAINITRIEDKTVHGVS